MNNQDKIILDLCGGTGAWSAPYKEAGYDVRLITLPDNDVRLYQPPENVYGILAAPPCTEFSIARNHKIKRDLEGGMEIVRACIRIMNDCGLWLRFWALENPSGKLSSFLGKPSFSFQPFEFGDGWTKRTLIWGRFTKPAKIYSQYKDCPKIDGYVRPGRKTVSIAFNHFGHIGKFPQLHDHADYCASFPTSAERDGAFRAITPPGFAKAFYGANQ
jgi:hypothetical protein